MRLIENPTKKVGVGSLGIAIGILFIFVIQASLGVVVSAEVAMAIQTIIVYILQEYFEKHDKEEPSP